MRRPLLVLVSAVLVSCAGTGPGAAPEPGSEPEPAAEQPGALQDSICENTSGGNPENFPRFVDVDIESSGGDTITFTFEPDAGAPADAPLYFLNFTDQLVTDGEGRPVNAEGEAFIVISFQAVGVDLSGEKPVEVYTGPKHFTPQSEVLQEVVHLGDFEGQVSWGLGLSNRSCVALEAEPDHITLEFPTVV